MNLLLKKRTSGRLTFFKAFLVLLLSGVLSNSVSAHWTSKGPYGGSIQCMAAVDTLMYVGTVNGGLFRSTDQSMTAWRGISYSGMKSGRISAITGMGSMVVAGTADAGVFVSKDMGNSWVQRNSGLTNTKVQALLSAGTMLFAGTESGFFVSTDSGLNWTAASSGLTFASVTSLAVDGATLYAGTNGGGVYKASSSTMSWSAVNTGLGTTLGMRVTGMVVSGDSLYAATNKGVYVSPTSSIGWTEESTGLMSTNVNSLKLLSGKLYAATNTGVFTSPLSNISWTDANNGLGTIAVRDVAYLNGKLATGTIGIGIYTTDEATIDWKETITGLTNVQTYTLTTIDSNVVVATNEGIYISNNNGSSYTWTIDGLTDYRYVNSFTWSGTTLYAGTTVNTVYKSTDKGKTWTDASTGLSGSDAIVAMAATANDSVYAAFANGDVYVTTASAIDWKMMSSGLSSGIEPTAMAVYKDSVFLATMGDGVYVTSHGSNWEQVNTGLTNTDVTAITVFGKTIYAGTNGGGIFVSRADSVAWTAMNSGVDNKVITAISALDSTRVVAGYRGGVYATYDMGETWEPTETLLFLPEYVDVKAIAFTDKRIFVSTPYNSVYSNSQEELPVAGIAPWATRVAEPLFDLYPNPNNGNFTINAGELKGKVSSIAVYTITGKLVREFSGKETTFDAQLTQGVYLVQLRTRDQVYTRRMIVK